MTLTLARALTQYSYVDRRMGPRIPSLLARLAPMAQRNPQIPQMIVNITKAAYLMIDHRFDLSPIDNALVNQGLQADLDGFLYAVEFFDETGSIERLITELEHKMEMVVLQDSVSLKIPIDLESFKNRLLIKVIAFQNYCRLACLHCGNAHGWDRRAHGLKDMEKILHKIRFPALSCVNLSHQEPFTLPHLLDAVEMLLDQGTNVAVVTSGLGVPLSRSRYIFKSLDQLRLKSSGRVFSALSFDLFRWIDIDAYVNYIAEILNTYPELINQVKFFFDEANRGASFYYFRKLLNRVKPDIARETLIGAYEAGLNNRDETTNGNILPVGQGVGRELDGYPSGYESIAVARALAQLSRTIVFEIEERYSAYIHPFMMFAGGDIVKNCNFGSHQIRSLGNIFTESVEEIYQRYSAFEALYKQMLVEGKQPGVAFILTEKALRRRHGISPTFTTVFDDLLLRAFLRDKKRARQPFAVILPNNMFRILQEIEKGVCSWEGLGITFNELVQLYKPQFMKTAQKVLNNFELDVYENILEAVKYGIVTYEELGFSKEELAHCYHQYHVNSAKQVVEDARICQASPYELDHVKEQVAQGLFTWEEIGVKDEASFNELAKQDRSKVWEMVEAGV